MKDLNELIAQAQSAAETVQKQMAEAQATLDTIEVEGAAGGGLVKVRASAKGRVIGIDIDDSLLQPGEKQMLEDLVAAAFNDARVKAEAAVAGSMSQAMGGMQMPPGFKMPF